MFKILLSVQIHLLQKIQHKTYLIKIDILQHNIKVKREQYFPRFIFGGNFGWGWRTAEMAPNLTSAQKKYLEQLISGTEWAIFGN